MAAGSAGGVVFPPTRPGVLEPPVHGCSTHSHAGGGLFRLSLGAQLDALHQLERSPLGKAAR